MKKLLLLFILVLGLSSCTKISYFEIQDVNDVKIQKTTLSGIETVVDVSFVSNQPTVFWIKKAELEVSIKDNCIGTVSIPEKVKILTNGPSMKVPLNIEIKGGLLSAFSVLSRIQKDVDNVLVSGTLVVRKGFVTKKLKIKNVPLSELYDTKDLKGMARFLNI